MKKLTKRIAAMGAAVMMMASISAMGASATDSPYSYGTNPVAAGKRTLYSGNRYTTTASTSTSTTMNLGAHVTQYYADSSGHITSYGISDADGGLGAVAKASVITPSGGTYIYSVHEHTKDNIRLGAYTLYK